MLQLQFVNLPKGPLWLVEPKYTIGASSEHPIRVTYGADYQADLIVEPNGVSLTNIADFRMVFVNGEGLPQNSTMVELKHGDTFRMGGLEFKLADPKVEQAESLKREAEARVEDKPWSLQALNHALSNKEFILKDVGFIGRSKSCDISLGVAHLSRKHAKYTVSASGVRIEDLDSSNGTFVNGDRIHHAFLKNGDELSFDTLQFRVVGPEAPTLSDLDGDKTTIRPGIGSFGLSPELAGLDARSPIRSMAPPPVARRKNVQSLAALNVSDNAQLPEGVVPVKKVSQEFVHEAYQSGFSPKAIFGVAGIMIILAVGAYFAIASGS